MASNRDLPAPSRAADSNDAVSYIIETCRATEGIWLVPTGPLTNIALALRSAPDLRDRIALAADRTYLKSREAVLKFLYERHRFVEAAE